MINIICTRANETRATSPYKVFINLSQAGRTL